MHGERKKLIDENKRRLTQVVSSYAISVTKMCCVLVSVVIGICLSQRNTRINIRNKLINDMYKTYGKASILVAQIDLIHNRFLTLQCPDYMEEALSGHLPTKFLSLTAKP